MWLLWFESTHSVDVCGSCDYGAEEGGGREEDDEREENGEEKVEKVATVWHCSTTYDRLMSSRTP